MAMLDVALEWAQRGFRVFPVTERAKTPPKWKNYPQHATQDETIIRNTWTGAGKNYNVGIDTSELVVFDIDTKKGKDGVASYATLEGIWNTLVVKTPSGGWHCYTRPETPARTMVEFAPGIDVRSWHGYVLAPGSIVHTDLGLDAPYVLVNDLPVAPTPKSLALRLPGPGREARTDAGDVDTAEGVAHGKAFLVSAEPAVEGQGGNQHTYNTAAKLVRDYALSEDTAYLLMLDWNERCQPPWSREELHKIIVNASSYGRGDLGSALPSRLFGEVQILPSLLDLPATARGIYRGNALRMNELTRRDWIVPELFMRNETTVLAGAGAGGKSILLLSMFAHFALGKAYGIYRPAQPLITTYYHAEENMAEASRRLAAVCIACDLPYDEVREQLVLIPKDVQKLNLAVRTQQGPQANVKDIEFLAQVVTENKSDMVCLDPLVNVHRLIENDNGDMHFLMDIINGLAEHTGTAAVVAHHMTPKGNTDKAGDMGQIRGASAIIMSARVALTLTNATKEDRSDFKIGDDEASKFKALYDAKANMYLASTKPRQWMSMLSQYLPTGDHIGVPMPVDMRGRRAMAQEYLARMVRDFIVGQHTASVSLSDTIKMLQANDPTLHGKSQTTLRSMVQSLIGTTGLKVDNDTLMLSHEVSGSKTTILIVLT